MLTLRYAITDRADYGKTEAVRCSALLAQAERLASKGVDFIQLREKDLDARELIGLARGMISAIRRTGSHTRLLIHSRVDIALAVNAGGVHLPAGDDQLTPAQIHKLFAQQGIDPSVVSVSCHTLAEVAAARDGGASLILFGPVFGKSVHGEMVVPGTGLDSLKAACEIARDTPVLALGGVTADSVASCISAGARGIAAIRLFH